MAKIGDMVSLLKIDNKTFKNPEWWKTRHKLKQELNLYARFKESIKLNNSYYISGHDTFEKNQYKLPEYANWDPIFRAGKTLVVFSKKK
jgi:hypothetical protein